jgi:hypothetical protein
LRVARRVRCDIVKRSASEGRNAMGSMSQLQDLDDDTAWELPIEALDVKWKPDSFTPSELDLEELGKERDLEKEQNLKEQELEDSPKNLLRLATEWVESGEIRDITIIINDIDDEQHLLTSLNRNDLIVGQLEIAKLNWFSVNSGLYDGEDEDEELEEV